MKLAKSLIVAALLGAVTIEQAEAVQRRHHHHHHPHFSGFVQVGEEPKAAPAEAAGDAGAEDPKAAAADAKAAAEEEMPTAESVKKEAEAVLKPKAADSSSAAERAWAESRAEDAEEAATVAKHDAIGKSIIADMYQGRAQKKLDDAAKAEAANVEMQALIKQRLMNNEAYERSRQAAAFKAHKAHVFHVKEHYAKLEAAAAKEVADAHAAWKAKYNGQNRLPLDTPGETWTANMPAHVIEDEDFHIKAPAPLEKILDDAKKAEDKAEAAAAPPKKAAAEPAAEGAAPAAPAAPAF